MYECYMHTSTHTEQIFVLTTNIFVDYTKSDITYSPSRSSFVEDIFAW